MGKSKKKRKYWFGSNGTRSFAVILGCVGLLVSGALCSFKLDGENRRIAASFLAEARKAESLIEREIQQFLDVLNSLGQLHSISTDINESAFSEFVQKGMQYQRQILGVYGLAPRVYGPARSAYESAMRKAGREEFRLVERSEDGVITAQKRAFYFPVSYVVPGRSVLFPVGLDLASDPRNLSAMAKAVAEGQIMAGGVVENGRGSRLMLSPIVRQVPGFERNSVALEWTDGFAFALLRPREILRTAMAYLSAEDLVVELLDQENDSVLAAYPASYAGDEVLADDQLSYTAKITAEGLGWMLVCRPTEQYLVDRRTTVPWVILGVGILISGAVVFQLFQLAGRTEMIRLLVDERTAELTKANSELEIEIEQRHRLQREIIEISTLEKRRVGQDLHDSLGQKLTGIGLLSSALTRALDAEGSKAAETAGQIVELLKDARMQTRRMARGLTPVELDVEGLPQALQKLVDDTHESSGLDCAFENEAPCAIADGNAAMHIYHIAQEALNNATKHAKAARVVVRLQSNQLVVEDDGVGLPDDVYKRAGLGLKIMQYRAETAGGRLSIRHADPHGTVVKFILNG